MKKRSIIWTISTTDLSSIVEKSQFLGDVLSALNLKNGGASPRVLKERLQKDNIVYSHFAENVKKHQKSISERAKEQIVPLIDLLVENSKSSRQNLKRRIIRDGLIDEKCEDCGVGTEWNGKSLSLQLDHKNGVHNDNRLENLRLLCPNCHSQTLSFSGRNHKTKKIKTLKSKEEISKIRREVGKRISVTLRKVKDRPPISQLEKEIDNLGYEGTGRKYNVSGNCIRNWMMQHE